MSKHSKSVKNKQLPAVLDSTPYVFQRDKISIDLTIRELPWTPRQKEIINLFLNKDTKMLLLKGPAGTTKTALGMYCGLQLLQSKKVSDLVLIRSAVESADSGLGFLPGDLKEKYSVYITPFNDKLEEFLPKQQIEKLHKDNRLVLCPVNYARGLHLAAKFIFCDESQNLTKKECQTILTRAGEFSKIYMCGDPDQSDLHHDRSGFLSIYKHFDNEEAKKHGIFCIELTEADNMRSIFCKYITEQFKDILRNK